MDSEGLWQAIKKEVQQVAKEHIPKMAKKKGNHWISETAIDIAIEQIKASETDLLGKLTKQFKRQVRLDKEL